MNTYEEPEKKKIRKMKAPNFYQDDRRDIF